MTVPWNGLPDQPEHSGWHWLALKTEPDIWELHFWDQSLEVWGHRRSSLPEAKAKKYVYGESARDPSELAQMRKDERERIIKVCNQAKIPDFSMPEQWHNYGVDSCIYAIRKLPDDEGKKS